MGVVLGRPAVKKETDRHEHAARDHEGNTELGLASVVIALLQHPIDTVVDRRTDLGAEEESRSERYIIKAADTNRFVIPCLPQHRKCRKYKVHQAIEIGHVNGEDLNNDLRAEQAERSHQRVLENIWKRFLWVFILRVKSCVASLFSKLLGLPMKQLWCVSFSQKE